MTEKPSNSVKSNEPVETDKTNTSGGVVKPQSPNNSTNQEKPKDDELVMTKPGFESDTKEEDNNKQPSVETKSDKKEDNVPNEKKSIWQYIIIIIIGIGLIFPIVIVINKKKFN